MPEHFVYVLRNAGGKHYIGLTENLLNRLEQHNTGVSKWTRSRGPWHMIWNSQPLSLSEARKLERLLKAQKGGAGFYRITGLHRPGS